jgi:serine/threonine protein phosphatase PrpC
MVDLSSTDEIMCLVIATDGIWDNLTNETMRKFAIHAPCLKLVDEDQVQGVTRVAKSIVNRISQVAQKNFPNQADNMTCALMYLMPTSDDTAKVE